MPSRSMKQAAVEAVTSEDASLPSVLETRYHAHIRRAEDLDRKGATIKNRLFQARALECAALLKEHHTRLGNEPEMLVWERRRRMAEARAFNHKNSLAVNIGAGPDEDDD